MRFRPAIIIARKKILVNDFLTKKWITQKNIFIKIKLKFFKKIIFKKNSKNIFLRLVLQEKYFWNFFEIQFLVLYLKNLKLQN